MKNLLLVLAVITEWGAFAQAPITYQQPYNYSDNLNDANNMLVRYWYYRWRLQNDFLIVGDKPGYSIPAEAREGEDTRSIRWGDGTIWLGNYLVMLATENALLRYSNRYYDLLKNERELYYAMQAFNRLDEQSDTYYDAGQSTAGNGTAMPACKNGFFIRDDVPSRFLTTNYMNPYPTFDINSPATWNTTPEFDHFTSGKSGFNYFWKPFNTISSGELGEQHDLINNHIGDTSDYIVSDYSHPYTPISHDDKESMKASDPNDNQLYFAMSQDQVYRLLSGFVSVIHSIPAGSTLVDTDDDGYGDTPFDFAEEAKIHATNIIARAYGINTNVHGIHLGSTSTSCSSTMNSPTWTMVDPLQEKPGAGNNSLLCAPMLAKIWKDNYTSSNTIPNLSQSNVNGIELSTNNPFSPSLIISGLLESQQTIDDNNAKLALYSEIVAGGFPVWYGFLLGGDVIYNPNRVVKHLYNASMVGIGGNNRNWNTYLIPLYCYLHEAIPSSNDAKNDWIQTRAMMQSQLAVAPCIGPYCNIDKNNPSQPDPDFLNHYGSAMQAIGLNGWGSPFRFDNTNSINYFGYSVDNNGNTKLGFRGFFNGIDYMSELNLYYITSTVLPNGSEEFYPFYHNLIDRYVDYDVSSDNTPMLGGFNSITLTKNVTGSAALDIQAGDHIDLKDGTHITASNASKHLYIKTFSCTNESANSSGYQRSANGSITVTGNSTRPMNNDYGFNEVFPQMQYDVHSYTGNNLSVEDAVNSPKPFELDQIQDGDSLVLYPNPTTYSFAIKNVQTGKAANCSLQLLETDGKNVSVKQERGTYDISTLATGTYIIKLIFPSGVIESKKLIKLP